MVTADATNRFILKVRIKWLFLADADLCQAIKSIS